MAAYLIIVTEVERNCHKCKRKIAIGEMAVKTESIKQTVYYHKGCYERKHSNHAK